MRRSFARGITPASRARDGGVSDRKPFVVCPGAAKAGTTTLYALMAQHPAVAVTRSKESNFFSEPTLFSRGCDYYWRTCFEYKPGASVWFEADPNYMYGRGCMQRIRECAPEARIVVMLRNPVDRAYSQYVYRMSYSRYRESFEEMWRLEAERIARSDADRHEYACIDRSRYAPQIREIYAHFPREQVFFLVFERFIADQTGEFNHLLEWLGLERMDVEPTRENAAAIARSMGLARLLYHPEYRRVRNAFGALLPFALKQRIFGAVAAINSRPPSPHERVPLDTRLRRQLLDQMRPDIHEVERLTGCDLKLWLQSA